MRPLLAVVLCGCFSTAPFDHQHRTRVTAIDARYAAACERAPTRCAALAIERAREVQGSLLARDAAIADARATRRARVRAAAALAPLDPAGRVSRR